MESSSQSSSLKGGVRHERRAIAPLDAQFGVFPAKTVPPAIHDLVFGAMEDASASWSYALFDAAKIDNFPERMETEDLCHDCLMQGRAREDLGAVSPWLVQLDAESRLCRDIFTIGDEPWALHGREAYIILRSSLDFDGICRHLRRFTKLKDSHGQWHFFRFYEPLVMRTIVMGLPTDARAEFLSPFPRIMVPDNTDHIHIFEREALA